MNTNNSFKGLSLAVIAATLWGVSGAFAQFVFDHKGINPEWLVCIRCLISGIVLLTLGFYQSGRKTCNIWNEKQDAISLILFSIFGMLAIQYTYFAAIHHSNAATATVLQYVGPGIITIYLALKNKKVPAINETTAIILVITGTFLLVTHGSFDSLSISPQALFWGIASAVAFAFYSIYPLKLLLRFSSTMVIGWSMLIAGLLFSFVHVPWQAVGTFDFETYISLSFIILFGSVFAFYAYLTAVKIIGAQKTSVLASAEPLSAAIIAVLWLNVKLTLIDFVGTAAIIVAVLLLTKKKKNLVIAQ